jgi:hypothetical protein
MLFNPTNPRDVFLQAKFPQHYENEFRSVISRAIQLIDIKPEETSIFEQKQSELEIMLLSLMPEMFEYEPYEGEEQSNISKQTLSFNLQKLNDDGSIDEHEPTRPISFELYNSLAKILFDNLESIELTSDDSFSWSQYFGLLALAQINQYIFVNEDLLSGIEDLPTNLLEDIRYSAVRSLIDASEAVTYGEALNPKSSPTTALVKDKISKQAQAAIRARYAGLNELKNAFIRYYSDQEDKTNKSEIARKFYRSLTKEKQEIICSSKDIEKAKRTLLNHLNKFLNTKPYSRYT